jgi:hypothetical protein
MKSLYCSCGCSRHSWRYRLFEVTNRQPRRARERIRVDAGLDDVRFHDLRHTYAVWCAKAGMPLVQLRQRLGHATITMTQRSPSTRHPPPVCTTTPRSGGWAWTVPDVPTVSQHPGLMTKRLPSPKAQKPRHVKAEGVGFEPTSPLGRRISRAPQGIRQQPTRTDGGRRYRHFRLGGNRQGPTAIDARRPQRSSSRPNTSRPQPHGGGGESSALPSVPLAPTHPVAPRSAASGRPRVPNASPAVPAQQLLGGYPTQSGQIGDVPMGFLTASNLSCAR